MNLGHMCPGYSPPSYERIAYGWVLWAKGWTLVVGTTAFTWMGAVAIAGNREGSR